MPDLIKSISHEPWDLLADLQVQWGSTRGYEMEMRIIPDLIGSISDEPWDFLATLQGRTSLSQYHFANVPTLHSSIPCSYIQSKIRDRR